MPEILPNWHPIVVHFAIALLLAAVALFGIGSLLAQRAAGAAATAAARWNLGLGILAALLALVTGRHAYDTVRHDEAGHVAMTIHMHWALATVVLFLVAGLLAVLDRRRAAGAGIILAVVLLVASGALVRTGWLGGENVYRHGIGVLSLPKDDDHDHDGHHHHHDDEPSPTSE